MHSDNVLPETTVPAAADAEAIRAIRSGDAERYRELVERHQRRVFAVAWSRLGDSALAEEATQETFIRAYRRLWMLGDGTRFGGWITSIARHVAINLGLSHRREQDKRARWALEQPVGDTHTPGDEEHPEPQAGETLRQSLEALSPAHRECLVLYYLEGRSGPEAAAALCISEAAFRVRLHRARSALRDQLDSRLEDSLGRLRPGAHVTGTILSAISIPWAAKSAGSGLLGAGLGQKGLTSLLPSGLLAWMVPLLPWVASFPNLLFLGWVNRMERQNLRDPKGFRAEASRTAYRNFAWTYPLVLLGGLLGGYAGMAALGFRGYQSLATVLLLGPVLNCIRVLRILRNRHQVGTAVALLLLFAGFPVRAMDLLPASLAVLPMLLATTVTLVIFRDRPSRMDYSLFLRAAHRGLEGTPPREGIPARFRAGPAEWFDFARFLGDQWLVINFRLARDGLRLRLAPVEASFLEALAIPFTQMPRSASRLVLRADGSVDAQCSAGDAVKLEQLCPGAASRDSLEQAVADAVVAAWDRFRARDVASAKRILGTVSEEELFRVPPSRSRATRWLQAHLAMIVILLGLSILGQRHLLPGIGRLAPVRVTETEVRAALAATNAGAFRFGDVSGEILVPLSFQVAGPPVQWMEPESLVRLRESIEQASGFHRNASEPQRAATFAQSPLLQQAVWFGWIRPEDLGVSPVFLAAHFRGSDLRPDSLRERRQWSADGAVGEVLRLGRSGLSTLRMLAWAECLDLLDRDSLIPALASVQLLATPAGTNHPPIPGWKRTRGLFVTPNWPVLTDTHQHLAALEILGGLDQVDREACIEGILRLHRGKGWFVPPDAVENGRFQVRGTAQDTFAAYESLRLLGALDRVSDLEQWRFRPARASQPPADHSPRFVTWDEIEALVLEQRFREALRHCQENPGAPFPPLWQP